MAKDTTSVALENAKTSQRWLYKMTQLMGLTTGLGIIIFGAINIILSVVFYAVESNSVVTVEQLLLENGLNANQIQSAILIGIGIVILELQQIREALTEKASTEESE